MPNGDIEKKKGGDFNDVQENQQAIFLPLFKRTGVVSSYKQKAGNQSIK